MIHQNKEIKKFKRQFDNLLKEEPILKKFLSDVFYDSTAYVVGGYFRDFLSNEQSRDLDIIIDIENVKLLDMIKKLNCSYAINRHGGVKLQLKTTVVDLWSIENNWAFKNKLVKLNKKHKLNSIAKGCFFNYDSLVINLCDFKYNTKNYRNFEKSRTLDILQKSYKYKNKNPTVEANIIRAFFLKYKFNIDFSAELREYIVKKIAYLGDLHKDELNRRLIIIKSKYPKYQELADEVLIQNINHFMQENKISANTLFDQ